jgi:hypothetical protein
MDKSKLKEILEANQAEHMARIEAIKAKWRSRRRSRIAIAGFSSGLCTYFYVSRSHRIEKNG